MKQTILIAVIVAVLGLAAYLLFFREPTFNATKGFLVNLNKEGVIIEGYDPVSYFTQDKPVKGNQKFKTEYKGATYWFANAEHVEIFNKEPERYAPQYGAFCGYAVSIGKLRPVNPLIYQFVDGRLILQHTQDAYDLFNKDLKGSTAKADKNWPAIVGNHVGKPVQYDKQAAPTASSDK